MLSSFSVSKSHPSPVCLQQFLEESVFTLSPLIPMTSLSNLFFTFITFQVLSKSFSLLRMTFLLALIPKSTLIHTIKLPLMMLRKSGGWGLFPSLIVMPTKMKVKECHILGSILKLSLRKVDQRIKLLVFERRGCKRGMEKSWERERRRNE